MSNRMLYMLASCPYGATHQDTPSIICDMPLYSIKEQCHPCIHNHHINVAIPRGEEGTPPKPDECSTRSFCAPLSYSIPNHPFSPPPTGENFDVIQVVQKHKGSSDERNRIQKYLFSLLPYYSLIAEPKSNVKKSVIRQATGILTKGLNHT